ncbi:hypothetical protein TEQG_01503 [Trichophyton equinum CBS 127.97]|uniref:Uncharacterized protein n=1 Tax=Trichophyton equinum (strain ATCC MYA-4606 / CBS 127.97) TaxID=559882 RepID=F2PKP9_TRIEC|nr:hypothetical protein TEQG_01503 [Trichophyton equinum CBS 127.97]
MAVNWSRKENEEEKHAETACSQAGRGKAVQQRLAGVEGDAVVRYSRRKKKQKKPTFLRIHTAFPLAYPPASSYFSTTNRMGSRRRSDGGTGGMSSKRERSGYCQW